MKPRKLSEDLLSDWASFSLKLGITVSLLFIVTGLVWTGISGFSDIEVTPRLTHVIHEILQLNPTAIISLGILILLITPIPPIIIAMITFLMDNNRLYLGISITLLCILIFSFIIAMI